MNIYKRVFEKITIYFNESEGNKAFNYTHDNGYKVILSGSRLKPNAKNKYHIIAEKEMKEFEIIRETK